MNDNAKLCSFASILCLGLGTISILLGRYPLWQPFSISGIYVAGFEWSGSILFAILYGVFSKARA
jgi:hypothetical protein